MGLFTIQKNNMKTYWCYIKSHTEWPDYDIQFEAKNDEDAIKSVAESLPDFGKGTIIENTVEVLDKGYRKLV